MNMKKAAALFLAMIMVVLPVAGCADTWYPEDGSITITATDGGQTVAQGDTTKADAEPTVTQRDQTTATGNSIALDTGSDKDDSVYVVPDGVNMKDASVTVTGNGSTVIELEGESHISAAYGHAAIEKISYRNNGSLTI